MYIYKGGKMKKQHKFLTILLIVILIVAMATTLIACDNTEVATDEVKDSSEFITNGNFEITTSENFPKIPGSWTASAGSTTSGNEPAIDTKSLVAGVIDTSNPAYDKNKKLWNRLKTPGATGKDTNVLMIYNKKDTSYKYTSNSFSLGANKIFRINIDVKTVNLTEGSYGAYIKIGGDSFIEFNRIDTKGAWITYSAMIKTSNVASNSINVLLSNGKDGKKDGNLSQGYAFFDNVVVTEVKDDEDMDKEDALTAEEKYNKFVEDAADKPQYGYDDIVLGDSSFKNISGTSNPYTARKWTGVSSTGDNGETAPTGTEYLERGIIDTTGNQNIPAIANGIKPKGNDSKFLMLYNKQATAYSYRTDNKIKIAPSINEDVYYKLSVWVRTAEIEKGGAYVRIKTSTDKEEQICSVTGVTSDDWTEVSIIIKPDKKRAKEIYLQLGLGTGGKNDEENNVKGAAFFDEITLTNATKEEYENAQDGGMKNATTADLESTYGENLIDEDSIYSKDSYTDGYYGKHDGLNGTRGTLKVEEKEVIINANHKTVTRFIYTGWFDIVARQHYRFSFKVKTKSIDENNGVTIKWYQKHTDDSYANSELDNELTNVGISNFNTENADEDLVQDGFVEFTFLFQGELNKTNRIYFEVIMGSGTNLTPDTLVSGETILKEFELNNIYYADYNSESGTYVKKHSFKTDGSNKIANQDFNQIDIAATKSLYDKLAEKNEEGSSKFEKFDETDFLDKNEKGVFGLPQSWTTSNKDNLDKLIAGVYNVNNKAQSKLLGVTHGTVLEGMSDVYAKDNENILAISSHGGGGLNTPWGFTSPSISITKAKYYHLSVWANLTTQAADSLATISLKSSSKAIIESFSVQQGWTQYHFYINAGFDNSSIYLDLKLGGTDSDSSANGTVFFDMPDIVEIDKDTYDLAVKEIIDGQTSSKREVTFNTTNFDNTTSNSDENTLDTPDGWTGTHKDTDSPSGEHKSIAGVYNRDHGSPEWFGGEYEEGKSNPAIEASDLHAIMESAPYLKLKDNDNDYADELGYEGDRNTNILVIHNNVKSEFTYSTTLADNSLSENKFYQISLFVLTYGVDSSQTAKITLKLHNSTYVFDKDTARGINVNTGASKGSVGKENWVQYSFYISTKDNANIDSVELSVSLGTSGEKNYVSGYLFVDNISITEISEGRFNNKVPEDKFPTDEDTDFKFDTKYSSTNHRIVFTQEDLNKEPESEEEEPIDPLLWLYITSGIVGGLLVIVVIVVLLKKFNIFAKFSRNNNFPEKGSESYNRNRVDINKSNSQSRDINKKHLD